MLEHSVVAQAKQIVANFTREPIEQAYVIENKGKVNQVCVVQTKDRKVVVRMNEKETFPIFIKEKWCIEQAAAVGIPGPEVLSMGTLGDTAYMIQTLIPGVNGSDSTMNKSDIWRQLGVYAKRMDSIQAHGFGKDLINPIRGEFHSPPHAGSDGSWNGYVQYNVNSLTENDRLIDLGVITLTEAKKIRELFEKLQRTTFRFGLIHGDISLKNAMVDKSNHVFLLDWGNAEAYAVPHGAIIQLMQHQLLEVEEAPDEEEFQSFLAGYGFCKKDLAEAKCLLLLQAFDNLRWAIDCRPELIESYAAFAKQIVNHVISGADR